MHSRGLEESQTEEQRALEKKDAEEFSKTLDSLRTDYDFNEYCKNVATYIDAIYIKEAEPNNPTNKTYSPYDEPLRDASHVSIKYRYIHTNIDISADTFQKAIELNHYVESECWINTIYDFYKDTLLRENKRHRITREDILKTIGHTEETVKNGITLNEITHFFIKYKLFLRVFDPFYKLIYSYDPPVSDHNNKRMYCMIKGNHVYTLNHDLKMLNQKLDEDDDDMKIKVSSNFHIKEDDGHIEHKMIKNINDLIDIVRTYPQDEKAIVNLILENNDLSEFVFELKYAGYEPSIMKQANRLTSIFVNLKHILVIIRLQTIFNDRIHGDTCVSSETVYNNMHKANNQFYSSIFNPDHKSFYSNQDIAMLNENRTIAPFGRLGEPCDEKLVEIDIGKAYSAAFGCITEIPIFTEFDIWKSYVVDTVINDLSFYMVYTEKPSLFFNKRYCLVYGFILKQIINCDIKILYYKEPSFIKPVKYDKILKTLFETNISEDDIENTYLRKLIAVVNFGMLERGVNKNQKTYLFETREEAQYYQARYGGQITIIKKLEEAKTVKPDPLDQGVISQDPNLISVADYTETDRLYMLNLKAQKDLTNGFRYIKELLMNIHNFKMYSDYQKLINAGIDVFSVKTDAFTIKETDADKARDTINFYDGIGGWRLSKTDNINIPSVDYELKINDFIKIEEPTFTKLHIEDEYDTLSICNQIIKNNRVMIRAAYGGSGKSYICEYFEKMGYNVLFVVPTNVLVQKYNEAVTINEFFGFGIDENMKVGKFDDSSYNVIAFDEILFSDVSNLRRIKNYVDNNTTKIVIATGDTDQLKPIESYSNTKEYKPYANECVNFSI